MHTKRPKFSSLAPSARARHYNYLLVCLFRAIFFELQKYKYRQSHRLTTTCFGAPIPKCLLPPPTLARYQQVFTVEGEGLEFREPIVACVIGQTMGTFINSVRRTRPFFDKNLPPAPPPPSLFRVTLASFSNYHPSLREVFVTLPHSGICVRAYVCACVCVCRASVRACMCSYNCACVSGRVYV